MYKKYEGLLSKRQYGVLLQYVRKAWRYYSEERRACLKEKFCRLCKKVFKKDEKRCADHVTPVMDTAEGWQGWDVYINRMFYGKLQLACRPCQLKKTREENKIRKESRANG